MDFDWIHLLFVPLCVVLGAGCFTWIMRDITILSYREPGWAAVIAATSVVVSIALAASVFFLLTSLLEAF